MAAENKNPVVKKRAPTLYVIVAIKLIKGIVLVLLALSIFSLANKDLPDEFNRFLQWVHLDPERKFFQRIGEWLDTITPTNVRVVASGTMLYGLFLIVGGTGLAFRAKWAIWLAIGESAFFIPVEIFELMRHRRPFELHNQPREEFFPHPVLGLFIVLALNIFIVWYLLKNRERLFRHHRH